MKQTPLVKLAKPKQEPVTRLLAVTPPRTGSHTMLGAENMLASIAIPEPFSLEMAGDSAGVTLLARCRDGSFVKQQLGAHYPQALVDDVPPEDDPLRLAEGEQAWSLPLRLQGPEFLPLRTFRDDALLDQGSDCADGTHSRSCQGAGQSRRSAPAHGTSRSCTTAGSSASCPSVARESSRALTTPAVRWPSSQPLLASRCRVKD